MAQVECGHTEDESIQLVVLQLRHALGLLDLCRNLRLIFGTLVLRQTGYGIPVLVSHNLPQLPRGARQDDSSREPAPALLNEVGREHAPQTVSQAINRGDGCVLLQRLQSLQHGSGILQVYGIPA